MNFVRHNEREMPEYTVGAVCHCIFFVRYQREEEDGLGTPKTAIVRVGLSGVRRQRAWRPRGLDFL